MPRGVKSDLTRLEMEAGIPESTIYTTQDEINFLRELEKQGKRKTIRLYRRTFRWREWSGLGMHVNVGEVERELARILGRESAREREEKVDEFVRRVAAEWLAGGHLRSVSRERALADIRDMGVRA